MMTYVLPSRKGQFIRKTIPISKGSVTMDEYELRELCLAYRSEDNTDKELLFAQISDLLKNDISSIADYCLIISSNPIYTEFDDIYQECLLLLYYGLNNFLINSKSAENVRNNILQYVIKNIIPIINDICNHDIEIVSADDIVYEDSIESIPNEFEDIFDIINDRYDFLLLLKRCVESPHCYIDKRYITIICEYLSHGSSLHIKKAYNITRQRVYQIINKFIGTLSRQYIKDQEDVIQKQIADKELKSPNPILYIRAKYNIDNPFLLIELPNHIVNISPKNTETEFRCARRIYSRLGLKPVYDDREDKMYYVLPNNYDRDDHYVYYQGSPIIKLLCSGNKRYTEIVSRYEIRLEPYLDYMEEKQYLDSYIWDNKNRCRIIPSLKRTYIVPSLNKRNKYMNQLKKTEELRLIQWLDKKVPNWRDPTTDWIY